MSSGIHIEEIGSGRPLVMLHGCPGWGGLWRRVAEQVEGRRVLLPDMPGYGKSPRLEGQYSFDRVLELLEDALLERNVTETAVVGFSLGGYRALQLALSGRIEVTHLMLIGTPVDLDDEGRVMRRDVSQLIRQSETLDTPFFLDLMSSLMVAPGFPEREPGRFAEVLAWLEHSDIQGFADEVEAMAAMPSLVDRLGQLSIPVRVLHGEHDAGCPLLMSKLVAERIPRAKLEIVPGVGHSLPIEAPEQVARAIANLVNG